MNNVSVKIWEEDVVIPTYETAPPDRNPMFFEKRVYQGSSGVVYPFPIIEKIYDDKKDKTYKALFLENQYIKIMVLPQLGGRIQMAYDKIANRHFIYYNEVIKPALVGLCGPWISGGIEFNWPQHHRPTTFDAVDFSLEENQDGSKTIWVNEIDKMYGTKGMAGFTLYPDKAFIEVKAKLFNRTPLPQTFLWWANPAVHVNDHYQSIFPPDVNAVFDHGRRDVSEFPIAKGMYYKVDYAPGTDISRYCNIPVPTSYMAVNSVYDFVGAYDHDTKGGLVHIANHHVSPGKKQWTWGNGDFGKAWDRNLTDDNGPYVELMTGVFTDNQPDFSWIMPYEEKTFSQFFLPYRELGVLKNANENLLLHFSVENGTACIKLFSTSSMQRLQVKIEYLGKKIKLFITDTDPGRIFNQHFSVAKKANENDFKIVISSSDNKDLLVFPAIEDNPDHKIPAAAKAPLSPREIETNETLFLTGLHLEQYRHATFNPFDYYQEALLRDASDTRCNNAMGLLLLRKGKIKVSEVYFRAAVDTLTSLNPNPYDGEPYYNLGLCLQLQHRLEEAYDALYKATWSGAWQSNSFFALAQIDLAHKNYERALEHAQKSLNGNAGNAKAIVLKAVALRKLNKVDDALRTIEDGLKNDGFNLPLYFETAKLHELVGNKNPEANLNKAVALSRNDANSFIEYAIDYATAGLFEEAIEWLQLLIGRTSLTHPMQFYYIGWCYHRSGKEKEAAKYFAKASAAHSEYCFPNKIQDIEVLQTALQYHASDDKACYYLGCLWFDKRQYKEAVAMWQKAVELNDQLPSAFRNLGIAAFNKSSDPELALYYFERAFDLNKNDGRILMELDQLYKRVNKSPNQRLSLLEEHLALVEHRDDLYLERVAICNYTGDYEKAYQLIMSHKFHPWEGGEGKVSAQYKCSLIQLAKRALLNEEFEKALEFLRKALYYPDNLGEGKLYGTPENEIFYWMACSYECLQQVSLATEYFQRASRGSSELAIAVFYNDPQPDAIFYQGLALKKLSETTKANEIFRSLVDYGKEHLNDEVKIDFFAVSLPDLLIFDDDLDKRNKIHCIYMMALGYLGQENIAMAHSLFDEIKLLDAMHIGAIIHERGFTPGESKMVSGLEINNQ